MGEETRTSQTVWADKKKNCVINIFCNGKKHEDMEESKKQEGHCVINIFCCDDCDEKKKEGHCIINIFCDENKKHEDECDDGRIEE